MEISLNAKMHQWINEKIESGLYNNPSEIILEGLRLLRIQEEQRLAMTEDLRREVMIGLKQLDAERSMPFDPETVKNIKDTGRVRSNS
ncbi:MAG: type II toxin-antitoxin system ParD family antitoxin [Desulfohalobiaceae bacterium]|nr:type II toxin-antitoxin system ParD family antitoxin [Desulfohalobiaceae bacterium]